MVRVSWLKELHSASEASVSGASVDATVDADDDVTSVTDVDSKAFEKYAPIITQFKVCLIHHSSDALVP